ncbi:MAG: XdhC family protein [Gemmatimonadota bacterium]
MSTFGLPAAARLARESLLRGSDVIFGVVVAAPGAPELIGRRLAWDGRRLHGRLGDSATTAAASRALAASTAEPTRPGCLMIDGSELELYVERITPPPELVIVGAGHIAQPLSQVGRLLAFAVTVLDDRPAFARRDRFPDADRVLIADFNEPFADVRITPRTHCVLVTRGHRYDYDCLRVLARLDVDPAYIGMIGSRRRVRATFEQLAGEGITAAWLAGIHAPIGLDLGAETPAEIAVAVAAEIIRRSRGGSGEPLRDRARVLRSVRALSATTDRAGGAP